MRIIAAILLAFAAPSALAQPRSAPMPVNPLDVLRGEFAALGPAMVYFGNGSAVVGPPGRPTIAARAMWLRMHPEASVRIEGHGDAGDTRDHALAMGARRAAAIRDLLILQGADPSQVSIMSWGKERPGSPRAEIKFAS